MSDSPVWKSQYGDVKVSDMEDDHLYSLVRGLREGRFVYYPKARELWLGVFIAELQSRGLDPDRRPKATWMTRREIAKELGITEPALRKKLVEKELLQPSVVSWELNRDGTYGPPNTVLVPAYWLEKRGVVQKKEASTGQRGTYLWDFHKLTKLLQDQ